MRIEGVLLVVLIASCGGTDAPAADEPRAYPFGPFTIHPDEEVVVDPLRAGSRAQRQCRHRAGKAEKFRSAPGEHHAFGTYFSTWAPEANSSRLTSFRSIRFDSPANNVGP